MAERPWRVIASNLHVGGGVQVAASLLDEFAGLSSSGAWRGVADQLECEVSSEVLANLLPTTPRLLQLREVNRRPTDSATWRSDARRRCAASLTVFGPLYSFPRSGRRIMGYADVTSVYPDPVPRRPGDMGARARQFVRSRISRAEAARQDLLIVETTAMRSRLMEVLGSSCPRVAVVGNAVNARVFAGGPDHELAARLDDARRGADVVLSYPTRAYPHKNLAFLPRVRDQLARRGVHVRFVVTLRPGEWAAQCDDVRRACVNLGEVTVDQVATVMRSADGVFFPSLLEAYSATPIEALALGVPLFASDRDFVRATCGDAATYVDPIDADDAARVLAETLADPDTIAARVGSGERLVATLPTATDRARAFLSLLEGQDEELLRVSA